MDLNLARLFPFRGRSSSWNLSVNMSCREPESPYDVAKIVIIIVTTKFWSNENKENLFFLVVPENNHHLRAKEIWWSIFDREHLSD